MIVISWQAWRLCICIEEFGEDTDVLHGTYSRTHNDTEYGVLYPEGFRKEIRLVDKIPDLIEEELRQLGPLPPPFNVTHDIERAQDGMLHLLTMLAHRDDIQELGSGYIAARFAVRPALIGTAAHFWPQFLHEGENHAIADVVHLRELIAQSTDDQQLSCVVQRFHRTAYHSRWLKATLTWEPNFCTFHGIGSPLEYRWRSADLHRRFNGDSCSKLRSFRPEDGDEGIARLQKAVRREEHARARAQGDRRNALIEKARTSSNKRGKPKKSKKQAKKRVLQYITSERQF